MESQPENAAALAAGRRRTVWHKLHHVRYHEADVLEFERQGAQHLQTILGERERVPRVVTHPPKADGPCWKRKFHATTNSAHALPVADNVLNRQFRPEAPNRAWAADISVPQQAA